MDILEVFSPGRLGDRVNVIDGASLIRRLKSDRPTAPMGAARVSNPPLTLYGAYRQGVADYTTNRANPYSAGSRLWAVWEEGRIEAETRYV
ncbi:hypothetical protein [Burkholderia guangdongensis]|uniref:hypothetical protein n=1 Tax=Burkholderia guangdongensis TaxID=1792500 RepID=UPI0015C81E21|nr:hypothetical protein [Burkholderia guangdongensis]